MICRENVVPLQPQKDNGALAQLVEHRTENPCVPGSIPGGTTQKTLIFRNEGWRFSAGNDHYKT